MPSSLIWVALVAGWVLVLFPMVSGSRKPVSRTGAATEETRVLHRGGKPRPVRRGPAAGHLSDPQWQPSPEEEQARRFVPSSNDPKTAHVEAQMDSAATDSESEDLDAPETHEVPNYATLVLDAVVVGDEADDEDAAEAVSDDVTAEVVEPVEDDVAEDATDELVDDVIEDAAEDVPVTDADEIRANVPTKVSVHRVGRGGFDPEADAAARAIRNRNRQRTMLGLAGATVISILGAVILSTLFVWGAVVFGLLLASYMAYMRRQVRMEQQIRERRLARLQRSRRDAVAERRAVHTVPGEARRYGAVVLEADDEDPAFEHLPHYESSVRSHETRAAG
ncbi:divisome protein SepX/GlpR [Tomitella biformata]|uniref:divisome protein SepX/GlpR n=1 Tax=Tomitella biformata TaxID=630403 RepID=UPI000464ACDB|nr:gephyrin-like molybdotransferase receptor GlpR [Tomitella biformata]